MWQEAQVGASEAQRQSIAQRIDALINRRTQETRQAQAVAPATTAQRQGQGQQQRAATTTAAAPARRPVNITPAARAHMDSAVFFYQRGIRSANNADLNRSLEFIAKARRESPGYPLAYYYAGLIRRRFGQNEMARVNFERATEDPELGFNAHFYLGRILGDLGRFQEAINHLERYIERTDFAPGQVEARNLIDRYRRMIEAQLRENPPIDIRAVIQAEIRDDINLIPPQENLSEIEVRVADGLTMAIVDTISDEGQELLVGMRHFYNREYDRAIEVFRRFMENHPNRPSAGAALYNIAMCFFRLNNWDRASREFQNYMSRFPRGNMFESAMFFSAVSLRQQHRNNDAQRVFNDYIRRFRNGGRFIGKAYEFLGDILADLDQQGKAIEAFRQADALAANDEDRLHARFKMAEAFRRLTNFSAAERAYLSVIELGTQANLTTHVAEAHYRLADYYYRTRRWEEAREMYVRATRRFPQHSDTPWGLYQIANVFYHTNRFAEAIAAYDALRDRFPDNFWAREAEFRRNDAVWQHQYGRRGN
jgi:tetratricopeptide (TPR) repeat protein